MKNKIIFALIIGATLALLGSGVAMATDGSSVPHGGYDESTSSCLYCHDIHEAAGDYVLMRQETVVETCGTCHDLYIDPSTGADNKPLDDDGNSWTDRIWDNPNGYPDLDPPDGTGAGLTAYDVDYDFKDDAGGHKISQGDGDVEFADGAIDNGDYIPGGSDTLNALTGIADTGYDETDPSTEESTNLMATAGLYCASCHTPHGEFGQILKSDDDGDGVGDTITTTAEWGGGSKLLSSRPNHSVDEAIVGQDSWNVEGGPNWCAKCHDLRLDETNGGSEHNHPSEFCLDCHSNYDGQTDEDAGGDGTDVGGGLGSTGFPVASAVTEDFPHSSVVQNVLAAAPDELCVRCHTEGNLP